MDALNGFCNSLFNILFYPIEGLGALVVLTLVSIVFMPLSMLFFKRFSSQKGIAAAKGQIKGHMIAIRIYQDDLAVVAKSIVMVLYYNFKYLFLNFAPFLPLMAPFVVVVAQLVIRFGFAPIPVEERDLSGMLAGQGTMIEVQFADDAKQDALGLTVNLPDGLTALSPLVPIPREGLAFMEVAATQAGAWDVEFALAGGETVTKRVVTGTMENVERIMQPERVNDFWMAWLWPAEDTFGANSSFERIVIAYPDRELAYMWDGAGGVFLMFLLVAFIIGGAAIKIFDIQI
ncbi:MAG: hypothetical protein P8N31_10970 [Planctomycetota bacterium]|nr:hypothetical protein [Planctomycetota bacterium]MDG2144067.1 hypothetical protein [Planctomycetota bacterium]